MNKSKKEFNIHPALWNDKFAFVVELWFLWNATGRPSACHWICPERNCCCSERRQTRRSVSWRDKARSCRPSSSRSLKTSRRSVLNTSCTLLLLNEVSHYSFINNLSRQLPVNQASMWYVCFSVTEYGVIFREVHPGITDWKWRPEVATTKGQNIIKVGLHPSVWCKNTIHFIIYKFGTTLWMTCLWQNIEVKTK